MKVPSSLPSSLTTNKQPKALPDSSPSAYKPDIAHPAWPEEYLAQNSRMGPQSLQHICRRNVVCPVHRALDTH